MDSQFPFVEVTYQRHLRHLRHPKAELHVHIFTL
jgi:hypothetical protein